MGSKLAKSSASFSKAKSTRRPLPGKGKRTARLSAGPALKPDVQAFCDEHDLRRSLALMLELVEKHLHPTGAADISLGSDPESFEEYVVVTVKVASGNADELLNAYQRYIRSWVNAVDWQQAEWFRLVYVPN